MAKLLVSKVQIEEMILGLNWGCHRLGNMKVHGDFIEFDISGPDIPECEYIGARIERTEKVKLYESISPEEYVKWLKSHGYEKTAG